MPLLWWSGENKSKERIGRLTRPAFAILLQSAPSTQQDTWQHPWHLARTLLHACPDRIRLASYILRIHDSVRRSEKRDALLHIPPCEPLIPMLPQLCGRIRLYLRIHAVRPFVHYPLGFIFEQGRGDPRLLVRLSCPAGPASGYRLIALFADG
jgi:hypothetical protein